MKKFVWIAALVAVSFVFWGCDWFSSDDDKSSKSNFKDYSTGVVEKLGAVPADGTKTLQAGTADTHEVETDGNWIVWKGRSINLGYFDGTDVTDLDTGLGGSVTPWAFGDCGYSPIGFDGTTIVAVANDVASADVPKFYYYVPEDGTGGEIKLPDGANYKDFKDYYSVYVSEDLAVLAYDDGDVSNVYRAFLSDEAPDFEEITFAVGEEPDDVEPGVVAEYVAFPNSTSGTLDIYNFTETLPLERVQLAGDGGSAGPTDFRTANGIFTWVEDGIAYYCEPAVSLESIPISALANTQSAPVAGPDYFLWDEEESSILYLAKADVGTETPEEVFWTGVAGEGPNLNDVETGDGFFAYIDEDDNGDDQIFVYDLSDLSAEEEEAVHQVTENGEGADSGPTDWMGDDSQLLVDGSKIYEIFNYRGVSNPSRVLVMYDAGDLVYLTGDRDFQQVPVYLAAGEKAIFLHRDHRFRLFAKKADDTAKPVTLTPVDLRIEGNDCQQIALANGVVVFKAIDTSRYLDNPLFMYECKSYMREIYCIDLDGEREIKQITSDSLKEQGKPQTDGTFVTWHDYNDYAWAYKIATGESKIIGSSDYRVAVDGGIAVWRDYDGDYQLYYCDLNNWDAIEAVQVEGADSLDCCPDIADGLITWEDVNHPYYYDLNADTPEVVDIYAVVPSDYTVSNVSYPRTDGRFITWKEHRDDWDHDGDEGAVTAAITAYVIVAYDTVEEELLTIPADDWVETSSETCYPRISDGVVVFGSPEYGVPNLDSDKEIFYCDITAETLLLVRLTSDPNDDPLTAEVDEAAGLWDSRPRVANGLIVWRTGGSSSWHWDGRSVAAARIY